MSPVCGQAGSQGTLGVTDIDTAILPVQCNVTKIHRYWQPATAPHNLGPAGVCCTILHFKNHTASNFTELHFTELHFTKLHCTQLHCTALHCILMHCTIIQRVALQCAFLFHNYSKYYGFCATYLTVTTLPIIQNVNNNISNAIVAPNCL